MANDEEYRAAVAKGTRLLNMLPLGSESVTDISEKQEENARSSDGEGQSQFIVVEALEENDYIDMNSAYSSALPILAPVLKALGLDYEFQNDGGKNVAMNHTYVSGPSSLGELYSQPVCLGYFNQICNPADGVLIADSNLAPHCSLELNELTGQNLPALRHWSDVAFLQYLSSFSLLSPSASSTNLTYPLRLKYVFRMAIQNLETCRVLKEILAKSGREMYEEWPGVTFNAASEEGKAIFGTPNGSGVVWLLAQHQKQFGKRGVKKITLFHAPAESALYRWPSLLFWIVPGGNDMERENVG